MTAHLSQNLDDKEWFFLSTMETWQKDCSFLCSLSINVGNFRELEGPWDPRYLPLGWSTGFQMDETLSSHESASSASWKSKHSSGEIQVHGVLLCEPQARNNLALRKSGNLYGFGPNIRHNHSGSWNFCEPCWASLTSCVRS